MRKLLSLFIIALTFAVHSQATFAQGVSIDRIDGLTASVAVKAPVKVATTANITLSGLQTIDGVTLATGDRVLVKDQTDTKQNGIYDANASTWRRSKDFDGARDAVNGTFVRVSSGSVNARQVYILVATDPVVFDVSALTWTGFTQFNDATTITATGSTTPRSLASRFAQTIRVEDFGAVCDGVTNDTTAIQAAFNSLNTSGVAKTIEFPAGKTCNLTNLILPTATNVVINGNNALISCQAGGDPDYCVASSQWVNNVAAAQNPMKIRDIRINGNSNVSYTLVWQSWNSDIDRITISGATSDGMRITAQTKNGTNFSASTLVNNRITGSIFTNNGGSGLRIFDPVNRNKATDSYINHSFFYGNGAYGINIDSSPGTQVRGNHTYTNTSGGLRIALWGIGTLVEGNYFEEDTGVVISDGLQPAMLVGNKFLGRLTSTFDTSTLTAVYSVGNHYIGADSGLYHQNFSTSKFMFSIGDVFRSANPFTWNNGSSTGRIFAVNSMNVSDSVIYDGLQQISGGTLLPSTRRISSGAPTTGTFARGEIVWNTNTTAVSPQQFKITTAGTFGTSSPTVWSMNDLYQQVSVTWDIGSLANATGETISPTVTVTGAALGDFVDVAADINTQGLNVFGWVSSANTVTLRATNLTSSTIDLGSGTYYVRVRRRDS